MSSYKTYCNKIDVTVISVYCLPVSGRKADMTTESLPGRVLANHKTKCMVLLDSASRYRSNYAALIAQ